MLRPLLALTLALAFPVALCAQSSPCQGGQTYDDGTAELYPTYGFYHGPGLDYFVSRFRPPSYPYHYDQVCVNLMSYFDVPQESFDVVVFDDDGTIGGAGDPGTELASVPVQVDLHRTPQWVTVDLGCVTVTAGWVWIGVRMDTGLGIGIDTDRVHAYRYSMDLLWGSSFRGETGALLVRALGAPGDGRSMAQARNGNGLNPPLYAADPPRVGATWSARVDHASVPATVLTQIQIFARGANGPLLPQGELLVDLTSTRYFVSTHTSTGPLDIHTVPIPSDSSLIGLGATSQALIFSPGHIVLCNAVDLRIGC